MTTDTIPTRSAIDKKYTWNAESMFATPAAWDAEVKSIIDTANNTAKKLISDNRDKLEIIANGLLEFETLDGTQVEDIVHTGKFTPTPPQPPANQPPPLVQAPPAAQDFPPHGLSEATA